VDQAEAGRIYQRFASKPGPAQPEYKPLQDFPFRYISAECGHLGMAVHLHTMARAGSYFDVAGANPLNLESVLNDPALRQTKIVMVHGGWPFIREIGALLTKPTAYLDFSAQDLSQTPASLAHTLRAWLEFVPEKSCSARMPIRTFPKWAGRNPVGSPRVPADWHLPSRSVGCCVTVT